MVADLYREYIYKSRYSKYIPEENRREHWPETINRYLDFISKQVKSKHNYEITDKLRAELFNYINDHKVMPSMRAMMSAGKAAERDNTCVYNCSYLPVDDPKSFDEAMHILMCFDPDTLIKTKYGNKKISELSYEDLVLSYDEITNQYEYINPTNIIENFTEEKEKIELEMEDGSIIRCTSDHKFLTKNRGWVEAKELNEYDEIQNYFEIN